MPNIKRTIRDSVFTCLFHQPEYTRELYLVLHPEDTGVTEEDIKIVTIENILVVGEYNDLGIQVGERLIVLVEAQSTFTINLALRLLLYLAQTYKQYAVDHALDLYHTKPVHIPTPELYVIYTGERTDVPDVIRLSDLYEGKGCAEVEVKVLRSSGAGHIVDQYVRFCEIATEERAKTGASETVISEILRRCREEGILVEFLASREKEVRDIMMTLFDEEWILKTHERSVREEALKEGEERGRKEGRREGEEKGRKEGRKEGEEKGILNTIRNMVKNFGLTVEQAVAGAGIPESERPRYIELLKS